MEIKEEKAKWGLKFYRLQQDKDNFVAEEIFTAKKPRSRVVYSLRNEIEEIIKASHDLNHKAFVKYKEIKQVNNEYCLLREGEEIYEPLIIYLEEKEPDIEKAVNWVLELAELAREAEKKGKNWPGFNLESLWVDSEDRIHMTDPVLMEKTKQYRGNYTGKLVDELYQPPALFKGGDWDEKARIYSLGIIFYYLLTGEKPYSAGEKADLIDVIINSNPAEVRYLNYSISQRLSKFVSQILAGEVDKWDKFIKCLKTIKKNNLLQANSKEEKDNKNKASKIIKSQKRRQRLRTFLRKRRNVLIASVVAIALVIMIFTTGGTPPQITEETSPEEVVNYFYQAINDKNVLLLDETTIVDLKRLERMTTEGHVLEKMQVAYSTEPKEVKKFFGIDELKLKRLPVEAQPVFKVSYIFYINEEEGRKEVRMEDKVILGNVEGKWQIVELEGDIQYIINSEIEKLIEE